MHLHRWFAASALLAAVMCCSWFVTQARAATFTVGTNQDATASGCVPASGTCSLRQLIEYENRLPSTPSTPDAIVVPAGSYRLTDGVLTIEQSVLIVGAGARLVSVDQGSPTPDRVFSVQPTPSGDSPTVTISGMTIESGTAGAGNGYFGGDILNRGNLTLSQDWITGGSASSGGGISNQGGIMTVTQSLVSGNAASSGGADSGGIQNYGDNGVGAATLVLYDSTVAHNTASLGGGIFSWCGDDPCSASGANNTVLVVDSTIAYNDGGSRRTSGGGLLAGQGSIWVENSIVADNTVANGESASNCGGGGIISLGHNLDSGSDCGFAAAGDLVNTDPRFTTTFAEDNGGSTDALAIDGLSPAVDAIPAGTAGCAGPDQRGVTRPQGAGCDMGAVEVVEPTEGKSTQIQVIADSCGLIGTARIDWGDGTTSMSDSFVAVHTYPEAGRYDGSVGYSNDCSTHSAAPFHVHITDAPLTAAATPVTTTVSQLFTAQVATFTDANASARVSDFSATIDWGDGQSSAGTIRQAAARFSVTGTHRYSTAGPRPLTITIHDIGGASSTAHGTATVLPEQTSPPRIRTSRPTVTSSTRALFAGSVDPQGLPASAEFTYGLDRRYRPTGFTGSIYDHTTGSRPVRAGGQAVMATVSNLVPNAVYHVRLVATNNAGTTTGPDQAFTTPRAAAPRAPVLGKTENLRPVRGLVLILRHGTLIPLTQARQFPSGTEIDTRHGTVELVAATGKKVKKYTAKFSGAVFKTAQTRFGHNKGLTTLRLIDGRFGVPSYAVCNAGRRRASAGKVQAARRRHSRRRRPSRRVLQLLHASGHGSFRTRGRYAAATVRGTKWITADRCDGTLISVQRHSVRVTDLVRHVSRVIRAGHSYLAKPRKPKPRHK